MHCRVETDSVSARLFVIHSSLFFDVLTSTSNAQCYKFINCKDVVIIYCKDYTVTTDIQCELL